ncbi:NAD(P)/FAD-dependent oxidoreductase [Schleiferilactobacillus shenzhenensis]|uniref:Ferredoxin--NADP reductase n=1 Tax=Schleiferilactobacillus shenzhenensis LY-73 TaxID=1231336 RepID=U4TWZ0_9LACO|nr:NAD(P)/FAD-dependent oxidoreductase [Schleiferilactobacillus shenzhenensis]ERL66323.1 Ferredoxin--NADP reductase 2 [Schleiferilactobacillus shenzhenensis LY-73]
MYDLSIIGGGPVGMFAAFYAGLRNADALLLESLPRLGGQVSALYPEKDVYDVAGFPHIKAKQLVSELTTQLHEFAPAVSLETTVETITKEDDGTFTLTTNQGAFHAKGVIIAIGNGSFAPRKLAFDYDHALDDRRVHYFINDLEDFRDSDVAVAGGGDSAIDWALALEPVAKSVTIIHRRDQFRGLESSVEKMKASSVNIMTPYLLTGLTEEASRLTIGLKKARTKEESSLTADHLIVNYGFTADARILRDWPIEIKGATIPVNTNMLTSTDRIYAIGDVVDYPGKMQLIASGFGEAPVAVTQALQEIYPERKQPLHSTSLIH